MTALPLLYCTSATTLQQLLIGQMGGTENLLHIANKHRLINQLVTTAPTGLMSSFCIKPVDAFRETVRH